MILGIDPGALGGFALLDDAGMLCEQMLMPLRDDVSKGFRLDEGAIYDYLRITRNYHTSHAVIEEVGGLPGQSASAAFVFGQNYQSVRTMLFVLGFKVIDVRPSVWTKVVHRGLPKGMSPKDRSAVAFRKCHPLAQKLPPEGIRDAWAIGRWWHVTKP